MGEHSSEDYLDNLLNSVDGAEMNENVQNIQEEFEETMSSKTESDFLREFESELESEAYDDYISDFESELEAERSSSEENLEEENVFKMADDDESLDDMLSHMENLSSEGYEEDVTRTMDTDDPMLGSLEELDSAVGEFDSAMEQRQMEENGSVTEDVSDDTVFSEEEDAELANIVGLELAEEIGEPSLEDLAEAGLDELANFDQIAESMEEGVSEEEAGKEKKKGSFLEKLKLIFFGEDDDEVDLDNLTVSNIDGVEEPDGDGKKAKKEKKKKEKKEKPPKEKKEKKEKPPKPPKPKKEKPPKEKDNTPPLPKGPVFMIWLMAGSLGVLVMLGTNLGSYSSGVSSAKVLYDVGSYAEAYQKLAGLELKEKDLELYEKVKTMASIASEYDSYIRYMNYGRKDLALDSLVCAVGRCETNAENIEKYGCENDLKELKKKIKKVLKQTYKMSMSDAKNLYAIEDRNEYTIALKGKLEELGMNED